MSIAMPCFAAAVLSKRAAVPSAILLSDFVRAADSVVEDGDHERGRKLARELDFACLDPAVDQ
ncbi:hypothetical protein ACIHDR_45905 [Nocardia sp. NPDC052278]|uniref:hypothetical protein n=1 Tax=unclassified Nocardia TaxID=2637762 RepID=UPI00368AC64E